MNLPREHVERLFDMVVNSLDFGSGFLESDDVEVLRDVAVLLGVDPLKATPTEFLRNYPHPYSPYTYVTLTGRYCRCTRKADDPIHVEASA